MKKEKTLFAYTASEENAFEICRTTGKQKDTLAAIRLDMIDDGLTEDELLRLTWRRMAMLTSSLRMPQSMTSFMALPITAVQSLSQTTSRNSDTR